MKLDYNGLYVYGGSQVIYGTSSHQSTSAIQNVLKQEQSLTAK